MMIEARSRGENATPKDLSNARNPDLRASFAALRRAGQMARELAIQTNTAIVIVRDGKTMEISAAELREGKQ